MTDEFMCEIDIDVPRATVWRALTEAEFTRRYFHATQVESDWQVGSRVRFLYEDGRVAVEGEVIAVDAPARLSFTWLVRYDTAAQAEGTTLVTYELSEIDAGTRLRVIHEGFVPGSVLLPRISAGWPDILDGLKALLEAPHAAAGRA
jgi:uncharacterized protein YndB with AHSA1/START domain